MYTKATEIMNSISSNTETTAMNRLWETKKKNQGKQYMRNKLSPTWCCVQVGSEQCNNCVIRESGKNRADSTIHGKLMSLI